MKQIKDKNGRIFRDKQDIVKRWKNYFERLVNEENESGEEGWIIK